MAAGSPGRGTSVDIRTREVRKLCTRQATQAMHPRSYAYGPEKLFKRLPRAMRDTREATRGLCKGLAEASQGRKGHKGARPASTVAWVQP